MDILSRVLEYKIFRTIIFLYVLCIVQELHMLILKHVGWHYVVF